MPTDRIQRLLPLSGVLFTLVLVAGLALTSGEPDAGSARGEIFSYWHSHHGVQLISNLLLIPFGVVFLLGFTAALRRAIRSGEAGEAVYSPLVLAGGVTAAAGLLVTGMLGAAVASSAHNGARDATYTLAQLQSYDWVMWMVGFAVLLLAGGIGGLRTRALPKPLALGAACLGVLFLTPVGYFALFVFPVWPFATGIALYRAERRASHRRLGTAAAAGIATLVVLAVCSSAAVASSSTSPGHDGTVAFRRFFDDQHTWAALFTVAPDGTNARQLTHPARGTVDNSPDWSPDGRLLAFVRFDGTSKTGLEHLWTVGADGSGLAPVGPVCAGGATETTCPDDTDPSFGPDSKQLTFVQASGAIKSLPGGGREIQHSAIAVANVDGSGRRVIYQTAPYGADIAAPMLSPDGKQIVFERDNSSLSKPADAKAVFVVASDGSGPRRLTPWAENSGDNPDWSPDGKWILFHTHVDDAGQAQYFLIHPDGTGRRMISHFPKGTFIGSASFSPDGRSITFAKGPQGGNIDVYTMRVDASHIERLTRSKLWDSAPDWGPVAMSAERTTASARRSFPSGKWRVTVTTHDLVSRGVMGSDVPGNRGVWTWTFTGTAWTEKQQENAGGPVTDTHVGKIAVHGNRVCFTDTGENAALGCYTWALSGGMLRLTKPTFTGSLPHNILRAVFTAHPWRRIARSQASARVASGSGLIAFSARAAPVRCR
jgi:dipeptidyl aminopeptidase/acylaminoacyl peptidase